MWQIVLNAFLSYVQKNPAVIEELIGQAVKAAIAALKANNEQAPV